MRTTVLSSVFALLAIAKANFEEYSPFRYAFTNDSPRPLQIQFPIGTNGTNGTSGTNESQEKSLNKRGSCPSNYNSCSSIGHAEACCAPNNVCTADQAGHIACCPNGYLCTGTVGGGAATGSVVSSMSSSSGFVSGTTTTTFGAAGSTVPNAIYPFVYIPTPIANQALCSSYWTSCQSQSTSCFAALAGGANAVTVATITVQGASTSLPSASASSTCSVLSAEACYNLQESQCAAFPTGTVTNTNSFVQTAAAAPRVTRGPEMMYAMGAGAVIGAAGVLV